MKSTRNLRDVSANLRHIANLFDSADVGELVHPVSVQVYVSPQYHASDKVQEMAVVDQMAAITGAEPDWEESIGGGDHAYYRTVLIPDAPWALRCQVYSKRPSQADALAAENERLRAKLALIEAIAATEGGES